MEQNKTCEENLHEVRSEVEQLRTRLAEAEETLRAIRNGEVDALVITGTQGEQIYTLKSAELPYRTLIEEMREGAATLAADDTIIYCNHGFARMLKMPLEKVIGAKIESLVPPEDLAALEKLLRQARAGNSSRGEVTMRTGDGIPVPTYISINTMRMEGISTLYIVAIDLTERRQAEEEIKKLNIDLERRVIERTSELEAVNRELEAFSYSVSHDLRAPLRSIDGFSLALLEDYSGRLDEQGKDYLQRVRSASQRMSRLIDDLLMLSRVTRREMKHEKIDLSAIASEVAAELKKREPQRKVDFIIQTGLIANGDAELLRIVLENLIGNAWKFTSKNPDARIEFGATEHDGEHVYFVRDNGVGFDMAYADKLFVPFQRLHAADEYPGTGIGLATVKRIVLRHGGSVRAYAEPGKGAAFYFTL